jgi:ABC-type polar amino acid transport system ATPase subunit
MAEATITTDRLDIDELSCSNGPFRVLNDFQMKVKTGETVAIIGRSGSGKSTLLRCLSLLQQPENGNVSLDGKAYLQHGKPLLPLWQVRQEIVMVFQDYNLFPNMTAMNNITLALEKVRNIPRKEAQEKAQNVASKLGIGHVLDRYPNSLSGGQAQRLALARAMVLEPKVLLLDEITSGLDPETIVNVTEAITELRDSDVSGNLAIVLVTHLMQFASDFADRICFLDGGKIVEDLPAESFFQECKVEATRNFVAAFLRPLL